MRKGSKHRIESRQRLSISHKGKPMLPQTKEALKKANIGRIWSVEPRAKVGLANKGRAPWIKGKKIAERIKITCGVCNKEFEDYVSNKRSGFCSRGCYWKNKENDRGYWLGRKRSFADRKKMSEGRKGLTAREKHPLWKGGISSENS